MKKGDRKGANLEGTRVGCEVGRRTGCEVGWRVG